jgi:hypothetical protein
LTQGQRQPAGEGKRRHKYVQLAVIGAALVVIVAGTFGLLIDWRSAEERLAEFEAARAIPDAENAATIYNELLQDPSLDSLDEIFWDDSIEAAFDRAEDGPWLTEECPEVAAWIAEYPQIIDRLIEASHLDQCRFPISLEFADSNESDRDIAMLSWTGLLTCAANNDLAEGRIDNAITKWRCLIQMENHLRQQPWNATMVGAGGEAIESIIRFIVTANPSDEHLWQIEALPLPVANDWPRHYREIRLVEDLRRRREMEPLGLWEQIRYRYTIHRFESDFADLSERFGPSSSYLRFLAGARVVRILVAAKRYAYETGHWPNSLDELKSSLSSEILTDPLRDGPFAYQRTADSFTLYSIGKNKIDENGQWDPKGPDDWPIWSPLLAELRQRARDNRRRVRAEDEAARPEPRSPTLESDEEMMKKLAEIYGERYRTGGQEDANAP